jgi:AAA family ATPase
VLASRAHGYVGADLAAVVREAGTRALRRWLATPQNTSTSLSSLPHAIEQTQVEIDDLLNALPSVRASALRALATLGEATTVKYSDIGGLTDVIQKLRECVEWPLKHPRKPLFVGIQVD